MKRISFVGDLMFKEKAVPLYKTGSGKYNFDCIFEPVKHIFDESDYVIGNLETTVCDLIPDDYTKGVSFNAPVEFLDALKKAGFNFLGTGNNHCLNRGIAGLKRTIENLDKAGFEHGGTNYTGNVQKRYSIIQVGECRLAVMAYTYGTNTLINKYFLDPAEVHHVNLFQEQQYQNKTMLWFASNPFFVFRWMYRLYATLKGEAHLGEQSEHIEDNRRCRKEIREQLAMIKEERPDYIIMLMHAGGRYHRYPSRWQRDLAEFLRENGVDIIAGHHEHRIQMCKIEKKDPGFHICAYDLGNFCSTTGVLNGPYHKLSEYSLIFNLYLEHKKITKISFIICKSVLNEQRKVVIKPLYDLITECNNQKEKKKLIRDAEKVAGILFNRKCKKVKREYFVSMESK